jgi:hypothetical protein
MTVLQIIAIGIFIVGGLWLLIAAFSTSLLWGLACLFLWPSAIAYTFLHWKDAKNPFLVQLLGFGILLLSGVSDSSL